MRGHDKRRRAFTHFPARLGVSSRKQISAASPRSGRMVRDWRGAVNAPRSARRAGMAAAP